ncbi:iron-containing redox enzyme family protein [Streptomyces sp. ITFR-16]|uniref:iron-containing redox enzyme family protein n=1 Tax=Streptomyces sp. ITFR-16 TaxID=3075198 RepID=UPI002889DA60|nr:iron-containing redox enzyme family protein [Streptomyces sp. ITFR-16]WNI26585.1 iron-containing redox enzyme family protein [Streptomyces sp. ITFR-16]
MTALPAAPSAVTAPRLPAPRGDLSESVVAVLRGRSASLPPDDAIQASDPLGDDLHLLLHMLYELHYRGFEEADDDLEWDPALLRVRAAAEAVFLRTLRQNTTGGKDVEKALDALLVEPAGDDPHSVSHFLQREGERGQLREYAALRSLYQLKEADPHLWVVPRLVGRAKAAMVAIEFDEFGAGRAEDIHARLFADLMADLDLDTAYGAYLEHAPAPALATVNLMSLFGLHRSLRGALVGHFAALEITSSPGSRRLAKALRRVGAGAAAQRFYDEHVEADAVHEQVVRREVIGGLLELEPHLAADVVLGVEATGYLEDRLAAHILSAWRSGSTALRTPVDAHPA